MRFFLALCLVLIAPTTQASSSWFAHDTWTLPNGLQIILLSNHRAPIAHVGVWYKVGGASDLPDKSGTAHYLEHLMFLGTKTVPPGAHSLRIKEWGGEDNAFTARDVTSYFSTFPSKHLEDVLRMEASRMHAVTPSHKRAENEHKVVIEERHQVIESDPQRLFSELSQSQFYAGHRYGRPVIGTPADMKRLTLHDAVEFHNRWYGPDNAVLIIAGDVTRGQAKTLVQRIFAPLAPIHPPHRVYLDEKTVPNGLQLRVVKCDARIVQPWLAESFAVPTARNDLQSALAADILSHILNGGPTSPLYKILIEEKKIATSIGVSHDDDLKAAGSFDIALWPTPGIDPDTALAALDGALKEAVSRLTERDIRQAAKQISLSTTMLSDQPFSLAMTIGYALAQGRTLEEIDAAPLLLDAVTLSDVRRYARNYLTDPARGLMRSALLPEGDPTCVL